jgi:small neutral amino acid transporter SnatA (MarC family)
MVVALLLGICLRFATLLEKVLGDGGLNVLSNIGGLLLLAIAVETIVKGVHAFFPAFGV